MTEHRTRKRFGQHFLHDRNLVDRMIRTLGLQAGDTLVEIGPGRGALTYPLLEEIPHLHVVELDRDLIALLRQENTPDRLTIHESDALRFDYRPLNPADKPLRVIGNLPYNISTPLIVHLLSMGSAIADMHFMLQKEVVERLAAEPGSTDWGRLSVMAQYYCQVDHLFIVPPEAFVPRPKVDSAIVRLTPHEHLPHTADDPTLLFELVKLAFGQRRKTLRNNLKGRVSADTLEALGIDPARRPQTLTVAEYVAIANQVAADEAASAVANGDTKGSDEA